MPGDRKKSVILPTIYGTLDVNLKQPHLRRKTDRLLDIYKDFRSLNAKDNISLDNQDNLSLPEIPMDKMTTSKPYLKRERTFTKNRSSRQSWHSMPSMRSLNSFSRSVMDENEHDFTKRLPENRCKKLLGELYTDKQYLEYIVKSSEGRSIETEIFEKSKKGLQYLKDRAMFWENQTPIPLRPDPFLVHQLFGSRQPTRRKSISRGEPPRSPLTQVRLDHIRELNDGVKGKTFYK